MHGTRWSVEISLKPFRALLDPFSIHSLSYARHAMKHVPDSLRLKHLSGEKYYKCFIHSQDYLETHNEEHRFPDARRDARLQSEEEHKHDLKIYISYFEKRKNNRIQMQSKLFTRQPCMKKPCLHTKRTVKLNDTKRTQSQTAICNFPDVTNQPLTSHTSQ